jgi:hypothetical protein
VRIPHCNGNAGERGVTEHDDGKHGTLVDQDGNERTCQLLVRGRRLSLQPLCHVACSAARRAGVSGSFVGRDGGIRDDEMGHCHSTSPGKERMAENIIFTDEQEFAK